MNDNLFMFIFAQLVTAGGVAGGIYAAIRADMREYKIRIDMLERHNEKHTCK